MMEYFKNYFKSLKKDPFTTVIGLAIIGVSLFGLIKGELSGELFVTILTIGLGVAGIDSNTIGNNNGGHFPIK